MLGESDTPTIVSATALRAMMEEMVETLMRYSLR